MTHSVKVVPYNIDWPQIFAAEARRIQHALGENCISVHHIGSTSVPGLASKPIIDSKKAVAKEHIICIFLRKAIRKSKDI
jgi:GrpB-like predicted nucleotidyltransferase (UPF0157 family)